MTIKEFLKYVLQDVRTGRNADAYVTIGALLIILVFDIFGVGGQKVVSSAILAALLLLLVNLLVNRHVDTQLRTALSKLEEPETLPETFLSNRYIDHELAEALGTAREAFFWGLDFAKLIPSLRLELEQSLRDGCKIRFLLVEPRSSAGEMAILARPEQTLEEFNLAIESILGFLERLQSQGNLEVRTVNYYPALNVTALDLYAPKGWMLVRMVSFGQRFPTFKLTRDMDKNWFEHVVKQFELLWEEAKVWP